MRRRVPVMSMMVLVLSVGSAEGDVGFLDPSVAPTGGGGARAPVGRTGQTSCYDEAGALVACETGSGSVQDGHLQLGVAWPNPRFTDNDDGTVTDNLTGLTWLDDADCHGRGIVWTEALAKARALFDGCSDCGGEDNDCGLADGSAPGEWRLPNVRELESLLHYGVYSPALSDASGTGPWSEGGPFSGVKRGFYWSSTSVPFPPGDAWAVVFDPGGSVVDVLKTIGGRVWLVRGAQVGGARARVPKTGQTTCYDEEGEIVACGTGVGLGQDGHLRLGVAWPNPRFTDTGDGTVTDNLTGLTWLDDANCFGDQPWEEALAKARALFDGCSDCGGIDDDCGLADGSLAGEWRLPHLRELKSLLHYGVYSPGIPDTSGTGRWSEGDPFSGVGPSFHWSSTTVADGPADAWGVVFNAGLVRDDVLKDDYARVWLVRGGQ